MAVCIIKKNRNLCRLKKSIPRVWCAGMLDNN